MLVGGIADKKGKFEMDAGRHELSAPRIKVPVLPVHREAGVQFSSRMRRMRSRDQAR